MILFTNGCSHSAGAEIEYEYQGECYDKAWPSKLAKLLKFNSVNLSCSGASADRVVRTTIEHFLRKQSNINFNPKDYFVIISWPGLFRTEINNGGYDNGWQPLVVGNDETYKKQLDIFSYGYYKAWTIFAKPYPQTISYYNNILLLQYFLISNKIKYLFWSASATTPHHIDYLNLYQNQIYKKRFPFLMNQDYSFTQLCHNNDQKVSKYSKLSGFNSHYDADAHKWFANYLYDYIQENKLL
jgi:hypothetical protein